MRYHTVPYLPSPAVEVEAIHIFFAWEVLRPILVGHTALLLQKRTLIDPPSLTRACRQHHVSRIVVTASLTKNMLELVPKELRELGESHGLRNWMMMGEVTPMRSRGCGPVILLTCATMCFATKRSFHARRSGPGNAKYQM